MATMAEHSVAAAVARAVGATGAGDLTPAAFSMA